MLPSNSLFPDTALALLVLPFRLVTAGLFPALWPNFSARAMPGTRQVPPAKPEACFGEPLKAVIYWATSKVAHFI
jgi:hypothetical protein